MPFFKPTQPILQRKQLSSDTQQLLSMKCLRVKSAEKFFLSGIYTCIDQAMLVWGVVAAIIFFGAQFLPINWVDQAFFWSILTIIAIVAMTVLTYSWAVWERVSGLLYSWIFLMILGVVVTDTAIAFSWVQILTHLCELWLGLSAIGYLITGWMMRSRAFFVAMIIHGGMIFLLPLFSGWQFAVTGLVMTSNLLLFSEVQWDMLLPRELKDYSLENNHNSRLIGQSKTKQWIMGNNF